MSKIYLGNLNSFCGNKRMMARSIALDKYNNEIGEFKIETGTGRPYVENDKKEELRFFLMMPDETYKPIIFNSGCNLGDVRYKIYEGEQSYKNPHVDYRERDLPLYYTISPMQGSGRKRRQSNRRQSNLRKSKKTGGHKKNAQMTLLWKC
jgi:hypothetical protein